MEGPARRVVARPAGAAATARRSARPPRRPGRGRGRPSPGRRRRSGGPPRRPTLLPLRAGEGAVGEVHVRAGRPAPPSARTAGTGPIVATPIVGDPAVPSRAGRRRPRGPPATLSPGSSANANDPKATSPVPGQPDLVADHGGAGSARATSRWASANRSGPEVADRRRLAPADEPVAAAHPGGRRSSSGSRASSGPGSSIGDGAHDERPDVVRVRPRGWSVDDPVSLPARTRAGRRDGRDT